MKKFKITLLAALVSSPLAAETIDNTWEAGIFGEYIKSSTHKENSFEWQQIEAGKGLGIDLQKSIDDQWAARFELAKTRYYIQDDNDKEYGTRFGIDAIYSIEDSDLYVFAGAKRFNNVRSYNALNVGLGYNFQINERFTLYSEAAIYRDVDYGFTDQGFKLGLKYTFGTVSKSSTPKQADKVKTAIKEKVMEQPIVKKVVALDTDSDGIVDTKDSCKNTPKHVKVDSKGCTLYSEETVAVNLNVAFENNSSQLKSSMTDDIQRLADFMKTYQNTSVIIEGHSSSIGSEQYNLMISQKRADAIKNVLVNSYGINENRVAAKGFGETQLISKANTQAAHDANRRVVAKIETTVKTIVKKS